MKVKINHFLGILCCLTLLAMTGCKDQGFNITDEQICYTDAQGTSTCKPLSPSAWVVMENQNGKISMEQRDAEAIASPDSGGQALPKEEFIRRLKGVGAIKAFDPKQVRLLWEGQTIMLSHTTDSTQTEVLDLENAKAVMLMRDASKSEVLLAAYGAGECDGLYDIDKELHQQDLDGDGYCREQFRVCNHALEGNISHEDGGPIIVVVDPAVMDPDVYVGRLGNWLDPKLDSWLKARPVGGGIAAFIQIEKGFGGAKMAMPMMKAGEPTPMKLRSDTGYESDCETNPRPDTDTLCILDGIAEIEECDAVFSFSLNGRRLGMTLDNHLCSITIILDPARNRTVILSNAACKDKFGPLSCQ